MPKTSPDTSAFAALLAQFGRSIGIPALAPDDMGSCVLRFDDQLVNFQQDAGGRRMTVYAVLGLLPPATSIEGLKVLLGANLFWLETAGATLALESSTESVVIVQTFDLLTILPPEFEDQLARFLDSAESWRSRLDALGAPPEKRSGASEPHNPNLVFG